MVRGLAGGWLGVGRAQLPPLPLLILFLPILPRLSLFLLPFLLPARPHTSWGSKEDRGRSRSRISRRRDMKRRRSNHGQNERISRRGEEADPCSRRSRDYARPLVRWCYSQLVSWVSGFLPSRVPPAKLTHFTPFSFSFSPAVARKYIPGALIATFTQDARNTNIAHTH